MCMVPAIDFSARVRETTREFARHGYLSQGHGWLTGAADGMHLQIDPLRSRHKQLKAWRAAHWECPRPVYERKTGTA